MANGNSGEVRYAFVLTLPDDDPAQKAAYQRLAQIMIQPAIERLAEAQMRELMEDNQALRKRLRSENWATALLCFQVLLAVIVWWKAIVDIAALLHR